MFAPAPAEPVQQAVPESAPQGTDPAPVVQPPANQPVDTFDGGKFNPDTLPEELRPGWQQLQGAFTQKTQELAERNKQFEALGDVESLQQAAELYRTIQDPNSWPQLYEELTQALTQQGRLPGQKPEPEVPAIPAVNSDALAALAQDPDLAPVAQAIQGLQAQVEEAQRQHQADREAAQREQQQLAMIGELQRQQNVIQAGHPEYGESDMASIYELSHAFEGNLLRAQERYQSMQDKILSDYLASKSQVEQTPVAPVAGGSTVAAAAPFEPKTMEEATDFVMAALKGRGIETLSV